MIQPKDLASKRMYVAPVVEVLSLSQRGYSVLANLSIGQYIDDFEPGGELIDYTNYDEPFDSD